MVPRNDHLWIGLAVSLVVTALGYALLSQLDTFLSAVLEQVVNIRERTVALMAICLNVLPMNVFRRTYRTRAMKGLMIGVMVLAGIWVYVYGVDLLDG